MVQPNTSVVRGRLLVANGRLPLGSSRGRPPDHGQFAAVLASVKDKPSAGRKNARGAGRTKESTNKGATKWCAPPLTKKAPYKPCARIGLARICAGGAR